MKKIDIPSIEPDILLAAKSKGTACTDGTSRLCSQRIKSKRNISCKHI